MMHFYYIDDVIDSFMLQLTGDINPDEDGIYRLSEQKIYNVTLGTLADMLADIKFETENNIIPPEETLLKRKLRETYLSYLN